MKDELFSGVRLWGQKEKREPDRRPEPAETRRGGDNVVPLVIPDRTYIPFKVIDNPPRGLYIRTITQGSLHPRYNHLADIRFDHDHETYFTLIYNFMVVRVSGQYLGPIVHAINAELCEFIHEYHVKLYDAPAKGTPVIEKIEIITGERED